MYCKMAFTYCYKSDKIMRDEIVKKLKFNNTCIEEIRAELQAKRRLSVNDIIKASDTIKHLKQMNATYRSLLE